MNNKNSKTMHMKNPRCVFVLALLMLLSVPSPAQTPLEEDIRVSNPDFVVYVPRQPRDRELWNPYLRGDSYNDHIQVLYDEGRKTYYGFWTQASRESFPDQHIVFSRSTDGGRTWSEPVLLQGSETIANPRPIASWQQPMLSRSGRLYLLWNQQISWDKIHFVALAGALFGAYSDDGGLTWSKPRSISMPRMDMDSPDPAVPAEWCNWQRPLRLGEGGRYLVGCSRHGKTPSDEKKCCRVEFWQFENIDEDPEIEDIRISYFNTNGDAFDISQVEGAVNYGIKEGPAIEEASIVGLPDGRLFAMMRSSAGSPVWSVSPDRGRTWSRPKLLRMQDGGKPVPHPRSPCPIYDWEGPEAFSGKYFAIVHNAFNYDDVTAYQNRGPLYLLKGRYVPGAEQPIWFSEPELLNPRPKENSYYTSYTSVDGKGILWYNDTKYYVLGKEIRYY